jgi:hydroxyacylglutathione hydrolase
MQRVEPIPAFNDNYIWLLRDGIDAHVVDPGDAAPVQAALAERGLQLASILITHHHFDHVGGVAELRQATGCRVLGPTNPAIAGIDQRVTDGDECRVGSYRFRVLAVPGHTLDHIAYFSAATGEQDPLLFCGDTLFAGGCGRIFEGNPAQMYASLRRLADLPEDTRVYCAHEYTLANLAFARAADPDNTELAEREAAARALRAAGTPTVPSTIRLERATNPFLRSHVPGPRAALAAQGRTPGDDPVSTFAALRAWKDTF